MLCNFKRNRFSNRPYLPPVIEVMIIHINMTTMSIYNDRNQTVLYKACVLMLIDKLKYITTGPVI